MAKRNKFYFKAFIIIFILICILIYILQKYIMKTDISIINYGELEEKISIKGVIIKDEIIVQSKSYGKADYKFFEGQKVMKGSYLADISTVNNSEQINQELKLINEMIEEKTKKVMGEKQEDIVIQSDSKYSNYTLAELKDLKKNYESALTKGKLPIYSPKSGFISYDFDGLENKFNIKNVNEITSSQLVDLTEVNVNTFEKKDLVTGDNMFKIINNFEYYLACLVNNNDISKYKEGKYIKVRFLDEEEPVYGFIQKINHGVDESTIILRFDDFFYKIYNKRVVDVDLISSTYSGIKIEKEAVFEKDGIVGVYIQDVSNIIKFMPVEILCSDDKYHIVSEGELLGENERRIISINDTTYRTVKAFDKVILNPNKVYDGQIVE